MIANKSNYYSVLRYEDDPIAWDPLDTLLEEEEVLVPQVDPYELDGLLRTAHHICDVYGVPKSISKEHESFGMEVGDDRVDFCRSPMRLAIGLACQEQVLHMRTSEADTCISSNVWNFCEVTNGVPTDISETFDYCRKNAAFQNLGFVDSPPLRIILDVTKGDGSHSSTASGKAAMLGTRMRTPRTSLLRVLHLASFIQDGMLRTSMSSDPKYLPRIMGGSGCRALYDNPDNLYLYTLAYKGGKCNRIYGSATRELQSCLRELSLGRATMPVLCRMLSDRQEYLHGTYANMIFAPKYTYKDVQMERLPPPLIEATGGANRFTSSLNRLVRTKCLVPRQVALREWEYTKTIRARLLSRISTERLDFEENSRKSALRKEFGDALSANTAFANLLQRNATWRDVESLLGDKNFIPITTGVIEFSRWDAQWLFSGGKYEDFDIEDLTISEDLHSREDVSEEQTFKVGGLTLHPIVGDKVSRVRTSIKVGLYEINKSMEEWAHDLHGRLLKHRDGDKPLPRDVVLSEIMKDPEWVNDDTGLIELCLQLTSALHQRSARVGLVSLDKRLANQMSNTCNVQVERLHPLQYIVLMRDAGLDPIRDRDKALSLLGRKIPNRERSDPVREIFVDTGSVAHVLSNLEEHEQGPVSDLYRREVLSTGINAVGHRETKYVLREIPDDIRSVKTIPVRPVLRDRRFPHRNSGYAPSRSSRSMGSASTATSWRGD